MTVDVMQQREYSENLDYVVPDSPADIDPNEDNETYTQGLDVQEGLDADVDQPQDYGGSLDEANDRVDVEPVEPAEPVEPVEEPIAKAEPNSVGEVDRVDEVARPVEDVAVNFDDQVVEEIVDEPVTIKVAAPETDTEVLADDPQLGKEQLGNVATDIGRTAIDVEDAVTYAQPDDETTYIEPVEKVEPEVEVAEPEPPGDLQSADAEVDTDDQDGLVVDAKEEESGEVTSESTEAIVSDPYTTKASKPQNDDVEVASSSLRSEVTAEANDKEGGILQFLTRVFSVAEERGDVEVTLAKDGSARYGARDEKSVDKPTILSCGTIEQAREHLDKLLERGDFIFLDKILYWMHGEDPQEAYEAEVAHYKWLLSL